MGGKTGLLAALVTRVVLVLGLAYVSLWWSYQHFYGVFAISPDDVGLAPSGGGLGDVFGAVLRLGLWLSVALLALGLLPVFCIALALYAFERTREGGTTASMQTTEEHRGASAGTADAGAEAANDTGIPAARESRTSRLSDPRLLVKSGGAVLLALALLAVVFAANAKIVTPVYAGVVVTLVVGVTLLCWYLAGSHPVPAQTTKMRTRTKTPSFEIRWWTTRQTWLLRMSDLFLVLAVIGVLFVDLPGDAHDVATTLLKDAGTRKECKVPGVGAPFGRFRLDLLNVRGIPATFAVAALPRGLPSRRPFDGIYLGSANGWIVIYQKIDDSRGRILRIPSSSGASIIVDGRLPNCDGVH